MLGVVSGNGVPASRRDGITASVSRVSATVGCMLLAACKMELADEDSALVVIGSVGVKIVWEGGIFDFVVRLVRSRVVPEEGERGRGFCTEDTETPECTRTVARKESESEVPCREEGGSVCTERFSLD